VQLNRWSWPGFAKDNGSMPWYKFSARFPDKSRNRIYKQIHGILVFFYTLEVLNPKP